MKCASLVVCYTACTVESRHAKNVHDINNVKNVFVRLVFANEEI